MIHRFRWQGQAVLHLLDEARAAATRRMTYAEGIDAAAAAGADGRIANIPDRGPEVPPALHLVHDEGVYLMSNAVLPPGTRTVLYAEGYGPKRYIGGDDFVEHLGEEAFADLRATDTFVIELDLRGTHFSVYLES